MKSDFLWDTNTAIYFLQRQLPPSAEQIIDSILKENLSAISVITEIELLSWRTATAFDIIIMQNFISNSNVYQLDEDVKVQTIEIRKNYKLKLPDAIIAATALALGKTLITRNVSDFDKIPGIKILDPFAE